MRATTTAAYLAHVFELGRAASTAAQAVKAANFRAKLARQPPPAGERTARVLAGYRRTAADRGRGQAAPFTADDLAAARGRVDGVIAGLLFMAGMRRSEVSAVEWRDVTDATDGAGVLVAVRQSKTNPDGDTADLRYLKTGAARAVRNLARPPRRWWDEQRHDGVGRLIDHPRAVSPIARLSACVLKARGRRWPSLPATAPGSPTRGHQARGAPPSSPVGA